MVFAQRVAQLQALRQIQGTAGRRYASSHSSTHGAHSQTESFGTGFYLTLLSVPAGYLLWSFSSSSPSNPITAYLTRYDAWRRDWTDRNALHTDAVERAAHDFNLFRNTPMPNVVELKYPEMINGGSPYNVPAGHGSANLEKLVAHYKEKFHKDEAEKIERLKARGEW